MALANFSDWTNQKKLLEEGYDNPLLDMSQEEGEKVYFGIHDLARYYKENDNLPEIDQADIIDKIGQIVTVDPINNLIYIKSEKAPFHYGYRKLKSKRNMIKVSSDSLIDISHLLQSEEKIWLLIDKSTKYQKGLLKAIRRKEMKAYMDKEAERNCCIDDPDDVEQVWRINNREVEKAYQYKECWKWHNDRTTYSYFPES